MFDIITPFLHCSSSKKTTLTGRVCKRSRELSHHCCLRPSLHVSSDYFIAKRQGALNCIPFTAGSPGSVGHWVSIGPWTMFCPREALGAKFGLGSEMVCAGSVFFSSNRCIWEFVEQRHDARKGDRRQAQKTENQERKGHMQQGEEKATRGEGKHRRRQTGDDRRHKEIRQKKKQKRKPKLGEEMRDKEMRQDTRKWGRRHERRQDAEEKETKGRIWVGCWEIPHTPRQIDFCRINNKPHAHTPTPTHKHNTNHSERCDWSAWTAFSERGGPSQNRVRLVCYTTAVDKVFIWNSQFDSTLTANTSKGFWVLKFRSKL